MDPVEGWDHLIDRICSRESDIQTGLYAEYIRKLIERIATKARLSITILAPISQSDIAAAFKEVFGREPDESSIGMLMRLPGLVAAESQRDDRRFVDPDMANICAAGDVYQYVTSSAAVDPAHFESCRTNIDELAADFLLSKLDREGYAPGVLWAAVEQSSRLQGFGTLKGDILLALSQSDIQEKDRWTTIDDVLIDRIDLRQSPSVFSKLRISQGIINLIELDAANKAGIPHFTGCVIGTVHGPTSGAAFAPWLGDSSVGNYEKQELTNDAILDLNIPKGLKVGLTALRKLYLQPGGGRQENSFYRGLSADLRPVIAEVLETMCSFGYATKSARSGSDIYVKSSDKISEVHAILNLRHAAKGELVEAFKRI